MSRPATKPPMTETQLQQRVIDTAKVLGWRVAHIRPARTDKGWRTPYQGHAGLPDLILARGSRVLLVELKTDAGKVSLDQRSWLEAAGVERRFG